MKKFSLLLVLLLVLAVPTRAQVREVPAPFDTTVTALTPVYGVEPAGQLIWREYQDAYAYDVKQKMLDDMEASSVAKFTLKEFDEENIKRGYFNLFLNDNPSAVVRFVVVLRDKLTGKQKMLVIGYQ